MAHEHKRKNIDTYKVKWDGRVSRCRCHEVETFPCMTVRCDPQAFSVLRAVVYLVMVLRKLITCHPVKTRDLRFHFCHGLLSLGPRVLLCLHSSFHRMVCEKSSLSTFFSLPFLKKNEKFLRILILKPGYKAGLSVNKKTEG